MDRAGLGRLQVWGEGAEELNWVLKLKVKLKVGQELEVLH